MAAIGLVIRKAWACLFRGAGPRSLMQLARRDPKMPISGLYILHVEFPIDDERAAKLNEALDVLRKKYGLDFFVMEPGMRLSRFDEI
jgi:hypothetical protein